MRPDAPSPSRREVLALSWPIVLANSTVPLLGLVDTAVIGNMGTVVDLGGIALGAIVFNFVYWSFGFLRMGTTGFTAQAAGAGDSVEVRAAVGRALLLAIGIGVVLLALQRSIGGLALWLLSANEEVESLTRAYFDVRIWGAPASLGMFALLGTFVGLGRTMVVLKIQLLLNGLNIVFDVLLAGVLGLGVEGIALGTAAAEWVTFGIAGIAAYKILQEGRSDTEPFWSWSRISDRKSLHRTLDANANIMIRTLFLLAGFAWFANQSAQLGDATLASNHILLQLVSMSAYLLDGYAHATEVLVGRAVGARQLAAFDGAVRAATELAAATGIALAAAVFLFGSRVIAVLTDLEPVRDLAGAYLPLAATYVLVSFAAFQLDGIFIGATGTRDMRNASVISFFAFLAASLVLVPTGGNLGLWRALVAYVVVRAVTLAVRYPGLRESVRGQVPGA